MKRLTLLLTVALLWAASPAAAEPGSAECILTPQSERIRRDCPQLERYHGGCSQRLAEHDPLDNFYSRDFPHSGAYRSLVNMCDVPTEKSGRGLCKVNFAPSGETWVVAYASLYPTETGVLFDPPDPAADPPDPEASSYYYQEWQCFHVDGGQQIDGSWAGRFSFGELSSNEELRDFADHDFLRDPAYWDAYYRTAYGEEEIEGTWNNPYPPDSPEAARNGWDKRWSIMHQLAFGPPGAPLPTPNPVYLTGLEVAEFVEAFYILGHEGEMSARGLWTWEHVALERAIDAFYSRTGGIETDPLLMFEDEDVARRPATWGQIKGIYR